MSISQSHEQVPEIYTMRLPRGVIERMAEIAQAESDRTGYKIKTGAVFRRAVLEFLEREESDA